MKAKTTHVSKQRSTLSDIRSSMHSCSNAISCISLSSPCPICSHSSNVSGSTSAMVLSFLKKIHLCLNLKVPKISFTCSRQTNLTTINVSLQPAPGFRSFYLEKKRKTENNHENLAFKLFGFTPLYNVWHIFWLTLRKLPHIWQAITFFKLYM